MSWLLHTGVLFIKMFEVLIVHLLEETDCVAAVHEGLTSCANSKLALKNHAAFSWTLAVYCPWMSIDICHSTLDCLALTVSLCW